MNALSTTHNPTTDPPLPGVLMRIQGRAGTAGVVNANRRVYPIHVYESVVRQFHHPGARETMLGELDHPAWPHGSRLERTALQVTGLSLSEGKHLDFTAHILDTPPGRTLQALLQAGVPVDVSTRGAGSLIAVESADARYHTVGEDYELHGIDAVAHGANRGAHIMRQSAESLDPAYERREGMQILTEQLPEDGTQAVHDGRGATVQELERDLADRTAAYDRLQAEHNEALAALNQHAVDEEVDRVLAPLRPDIRRTVQGQFSACATPAEVSERWTAIESVFSAAGLLTPEPAGIGRPANAETPAASPYTPTQQMQRRLLEL